MSTSLFAHPLTLAEHAGTLSLLHSELADAVAGSDLRKQHQQCRTLRMLLGLEEELHPHHPTQRNTLLANSCSLDSLGLSFNT